MKCSMMCKPEHPQATQAIYLAWKLRRIPADIVEATLTSKRFPRRLYDLAVQLQTIKPPTKG